MSFWSKPGFWPGFITGAATLIVVGMLIRR